MDPGGWKSRVQDGEGTSERVERVGMDYGGKGPPDIESIKIHDLHLVSLFTRRGIVFINQVSHRIITLQKDSSMLIDSLN